MKRLTLLVLLIAGLVAPMALTGCEDSACPDSKVVSALDEMSAVATAFSDLSPRLEAAVTPEEYDALIADYNAVKAQAEAIDTPECMLEIKSELIATYDSYIKAVQGIKDNDIDAMQSNLDEGSQHFDKWQELMDAFVKSRS